MSVAAETGSNEVAFKWKQYAGGGLRNLVLDSPGGNKPARMVVILAAGSFSVLKDAQDRDNPIGPLPAGYPHQGYVTEANCDQAFIAYW